MAEIGTNMLGRLARFVSRIINVMSDPDRSDNGVIERKVTAERDEGFVVFHVRMRINAFWKIHRWLPLLLIAPRMVRELVDDGASGLLGSRTVLGPGVRHIGFIQYWESFDSLREYARNDDRSHFPAWRAYYRSGTNADAAVGIWHETYLVRANEYETVYTNMPPHGLAACDETEIVPAADRRKTAAGRLERADGPDFPVDASEAG